MILRAALLALFLGTPLAAQTAFDVVSIRPTAPDDWNLSMSLRDGTLDGNLLLKSYITSAYGIREGQIFGLPAWAEHAKYTVHAKLLDPALAASGSLSKEQRRALMTSLLTEYFHLRVHRETRLLPRYELLIDKGGPKFTATASDPATTGKPPAIEYREGYLHTRAAFLLALVSCVEENVDRPVVDSTALSGRYDLTLWWTPQDSPTPTSADAPPNLFTALREQLGLRLQPNRGPVEVLVVDHIEPPAAN